MNIQLSVDYPYDFARSVQDYGWIDLAPFRWLEEEQALQRVERLANGQVVLAHIMATRSGDTLALSGGVQAASPVDEVEIREVASKIRWMLRLDENFGPFYRRAADDARLWQEVRSGRGRLLRSPSLFEDVVKTICTTNTTWRQTVGMVDRLVHYLGEPYLPDPDLRAFPTPAQIAETELERLQNEIRLGYRSAYVRRLAQEIVAGERDLEALKESNLPTGELKEQLKSIKGVGEYAANTLLMLLGRYEALAVDSEMRTFVAGRYLDGHPLTDENILSIYEDWGEWKYLAYWFDLLA